MLEIRDLTLFYGERVALRDVSLSLARGELLGVVGPNASGKSSLIRAITNVVTPQRGEIRLDGSLVRRLSRRELSLRVAVVPQNPTLPEAFTTLEVVLMGRTPHLGLLQSERRADWAAVRRALEQTDAFELAEQADRRALRRREAAGGRGPRPGPGGAAPAAGRADRPPGRGPSGDGAGAAAEALPRATGPMVAPRRCWRWCTT